MTLTGPTVALTLCALLIVAACLAVTYEGTVTMPGLEAAKMYVALLGTIATALLGVFAADTVVGQVLTVIAVIATAVATFSVPNQRKTP